MSYPRQDFSRYFRLQWIDDENCLVIFKYSQECATVFQALKEQECPFGMTLTYGGDVTDITATGGGSKGSVHARAFADGRKMVLVPLGETDKSLRSGGSDGGNWRKRNTLSSAKAAELYRDISHKSGVSTANAYDSLADGGGGSGAGPAAWGAQSDSNTGAWHPTKNPNGVREAEAAVPDSWDQLLDSDSEESADGGAASGSAGANASSGNDGSSDGGSDAGGATEQLNAEAEVFKPSFAAAAAAHAAPPTIDNNAPDEDKVAALLAMGFSVDDTMNALVTARNDVNAAINILMGSQ